MIKPQDWALPTYVLFRRATSGVRLSAAAPVRSRETRASVYAFIDSRQLVAGAINTRHYLVCLMWSDYFGPLRIPSGTRYCFLVIMLCLSRKMATSCVASALV